MSLRTSSSKYSVGIEPAIEIPMSGHALERYQERLPDDAVSVETAWSRGEDINHPAVLATFSSSPDPSRVRVYNHNQEYFAVFLIFEDGDGGECIGTVYNLHTHDHGPTQAYLASHGPHYLESEESVDDE